MKDLMEYEFDFFQSLSQTDTYPEKEVLQNIRIDPTYDVAVLLDHNKKIRPRELFTKLQQDRITFQDSILLLNYIFQKILTPARKDYFTAKKHVDNSYSFCDADIEAEILGSLYREEDGPTGFSYFEHGCDEYTYYTYSCNVEQYKNRLRLKAFLDAIRDFGLLETPEKEI